MQIYLKYRPYLFEFLEELKAKYEIIVYSTMSERYLSLLVKSIEKKLGWSFAHVIGSEGCVAISSIIFLKNIELIGKSRDLEDVISIDSNIFNYFLHTKHIVPLTIYRPSKPDEGLKKLCEFLKIVASSKESALISLKRAILLP